MESTRAYSIVHTLGGTMLAFVTWLVIYILSHVLLFLLDSSRGLDDNLLQGIFRELISPAVGGYAAIVAVSRFLPKAKLSWVAIVFCFPIVVFYLFLSLYLITFQSSNYEFSWSEQILNWGIAFASCIGAYFGVRSTIS